MGTGLLFKWEDTPALSHHCGFCERPLSHPGARASCFGTHAEPCHRYHQAMFMRLRSHTCHYCHTIDEAHYRRHKEIAEAIRNVYESCGEIRSTIIPCEPIDRGRSRAGHDVWAQDGHIGRSRSRTPDDTHSSRREKKDAKCLSRAASRTRIISRDEILYVGSVIHSAGGTSMSDSVEPRNAEEVEEIERHLKYNANVYNTHQGHHDFKRFARLADVHVDFDFEVERVLKVFHVTELLKCNAGNRGLQGKELRIFSSLVDELKKMVVDDLVLVKRDILEIRMRRAGYLRYTSKTAHDIVEARYSDKDWKTGEKFSSNHNGSNKIVTPVEKSSDSANPPVEEVLRTSSAASEYSPDRRHLEKSHTRINGDDRIGQNLIKPDHAPLPPLALEPPSGKPPVSIRLVTNKAETLEKDQQNRKDKQVGNSAWQTVLHGKRYATATVKPSWGVTASGRPLAASRRLVTSWGLDGCVLPNSRSSKAPAVQSPTDIEISTSEGPDHFVDSHDSATKEPVIDITVVPQRKSKQQQETRSDARETAYQSVATIPANGVTESAKATVGAHEDHPLRNLPQNESRMENTNHRVMTTQAQINEAESHKVLPEPSPTESLPVAYKRKHMHWTKFKRHFIADQLTDPFLASSSGCWHGTSCAFEANGIPDCPFHDPHCSCVDPLLDQCYLVYPCNDTLSSGPYNRLRGEKLLAMYQHEEHFNGRIMLVDNDLVNYFMLDPHTRMYCQNAAHVPQRLAKEYAEFAEGGRNPGPLMEQERQFERLWTKNNIIKRQLSRDMLSQVQHQKFELLNRPFMCYCNDNIPETGLPTNIVKCAYRRCSMRYFHKTCVKKLGVEKLSRWFCTLCEGHIRSQAYRVLRELGFDDVPDEDEEMRTNMRRLREQFPISDAAMELLCQRVKEIGGGVSVAKVMAMAVGGMY